MKLNFTIAEHDSQLQTHQIVGLCDYLSAKVLEPMFRKNSWNWDRRFMNFFTCDNTCNPLDPTGTIKFNVPRLFLGQVGELEDRIQKELSALGIQTGVFVHQREAAGTDCVILIPITDNPTAMVMPPEVNISQTRGCLVLRDLLGYERVNGRYEFAADDLLQRASAVTEDKIAACTASPVWDPKSSPVVSRKPSPVSIKAMKRCLEEIKSFAQWAMNHNYRKLAAV